MLIRCLDFPQLPAFGQKPRKRRSVTRIREPHEETSAPNADQKSGKGFGLPVTTGAWPSKGRLGAVWSGRGP